MTILYTSDEISAVQVANWTSPGSLSVHLAQASLHQAAGPLRRVWTKHGAASAQGEKEAFCYGGVLVGVCGDIS